MQQIGRVIVTKPPTSMVYSNPLKKEILLVIAIACAVMIMLLITLFTRACCTSDPQEIVPDDNIDNTNQNLNAANDIQDLEDL
ncbi:hypothetical protein TVAG_336590 [Trichomonas vaginalis G3]|uniref:Uncharacterized protein n=1 Tax=Trichomonas vaginalis (strain ATCC PRA-98 / G3) TaxID=412133 RepID=A2FLW3_TRIV3|nr:hypothetical protein TVAG_336590 [Trichomonas vaginalis G3]|eukprot:XP_001307026.1 hypothetical protein [Trichomonas vaginalis G3]